MWFLIISTLRFTEWSGQAAQSFCSTSSASSCRREVWGTETEHVEIILLFRLIHVGLWRSVLLLASSQDIMYPYGPSHGDLETPKMDDGSSPEVTLTIQFIFFSAPYRTIYVSLGWKLGQNSRVFPKQTNKKEPVSSVHRSTTTAWSPSTCRSASSRQRLFLWATAGHSSLHFGLMCTTVSAEMCTTENLLNRKSWKGQHKMSGSTSKACPASPRRGRSFQRGTRSLSTEEARRPR